MRLSYLNSVEEELLSALKAEGVAFAVVGGHAVLCYTPVKRPDGTLRILGDLDVLIDPSLSNLEKISLALARLRINITSSKLQDAFDTLKIPNLLMYRTQLFPAIRGVQTEEVLAQTQDVDSSIGSIPIISKRLLLVAKNATGRPKDLEDVRALELE
jgi:hypothetical protein